MANTEQKYNFKLSLTAGLINDYGIFNLRKGSDLDTDDAYNNIKVMVFIDGQQYVENDATQIMHAGESSFKEFDGVLPTLTDAGGGTEWEVENYGLELRLKLLQYLTLRLNTNGPELYGNASAYTYYKNQFKVEFKETGISYTNDESYITYKEVTDNLKDRLYVDKTLDSLSGTSPEKYMYLNANIVHFSKYYKIYSTSSAAVPQLLPLIHDLDSLADYGLGLDAQGWPYVATLWGHKHWAGKSGGGEHTYFKNNLYSYDTTSATNGYQVTRNGEANNFADLGCKFEDEDEHDVSMFKSNYWGADTFRVFNEDDWVLYFPKGFALFGIEEESDVEITLSSKNGRGTSERNSSYTADYTKIFLPETSLYNFQHKYISNNDRSSCIVAVAQYADSDGNPHVFNTWFPVKISGDFVTQEIIYKEGMGTDKPKYVGSYVASILANIYLYKDDIPGVVGYVSDIIYLAPNATLFVKDIVFKARVTLPLEPSYELTEETNKLLLINKVSYNDYVKSILTLATISQDELSKINFTNVNAIIKGCVKNIPLLFNLNYKEPNTDSVNQKDALVLIKRIDGTTTTILRSSILQKDKLYQVTTNDEGENVVEYLNANFNIRFIGKMSDDGSNLKAEYLNIPSVKSSMIHKMFKVESELMIPANSRAMSAYGKYYSIGTYFSGHQDNAVKDFVKDEVLIPYARVL